MRVLDTHPHTGPRPGHLPWSWTGFCPALTGCLLPLLLAWPSCRTNYNCRHLRRLLSAHIRSKRVRRMHQMTCLAHYFSGVIAGFLLGRQHRIMACIRAAPCRTCRSLRISKTRPGIGDDPSCRKKIYPHAGNPKQQSADNVRSSRPEKLGFGQRHTGSKT